MKGKVTFVGTGTGDPRLLTVRGAEVLARADLVLFDADVHPDVLARLPGGTPRHLVTREMRPESVGQRLAHEAEQGRHAVRLAWADPLLFGAGDLEASIVARHGVPVEIVPGIGPLTALGAFAACPLTRSNDASPSVASVRVSRGHEGLHDWAKLATATDTLVILADADSLAEVARSLVFYGRDALDRTTIVEDLSLPSQRVTEAALREVPLLPPPRAARVALVVGQRGERMPELAWMERRPLFGKRVLVTRAREQAGETAALLRERGADPIVIPTIELRPPTEPAKVSEAARALAAARYDWVVLTSASGVERLWDEIRRQGKDARAFGVARLAVVGPGTAAALERIGLHADLVARDYKGEGLAADLTRALEAERAPGRAAPRVLLARAEVARDVVPDALRAIGCEVDVVAVYKTHASPGGLRDALAPLLEERRVDVVTFTSSSTVEHLCDALGGRAPELLSSACVASIGPITTATAEARGLRVDVTAREHTVPALVDALEAHLAGAPSGGGAA